MAPIVALVVTGNAANVKRKGNYLFVICASLWFIFDVLVLRLMLSRPVAGFVNTVIPATEYDSKSIFPNDS